MPDSHQDHPILRTKLHRPRTYGDLVVRDRLMGKLDRGLNFPFSLICAPAGYGKSTLISQWLDTVDKPQAWISLDRSLNEIRIFLDYLTTAIGEAIPESCPRTIALLGQTSLPPLSVLSATLCSELDSLQEPLILTLEDYHCITAVEVHSQVDDLLKHVPEALHLSIISRIDPPLIVGRLRANRKMTEIRMKHLRFTRDELIQYFEGALGIAFSESQIDKLHSFTEGWPVAMQLASLAMHDREDRADAIQSFGQRNRDVEGYLFEEVLGGLPEGARMCLARISILDRFCSPLCAALCHVEGSENLGEGDFQGLLKSTGLLRIPLDDEDKWFRFHHLLQDVLKSFLERNMGREEIAHLHLKAAKWLEDHECLEEAIEQYLRASKQDEVVRMIKAHRYAFANKELWLRLIQWLDKLPPNLIEVDPELLHLRSRKHDFLSNYGEAIADMDLALELLDSSDYTPGEKRRIKAEVNSMYCAFLLHAGMGQQSLEMLEGSLRDLPEVAGNQRVYALMVQAGALQMVGRQQEALEKTKAALQDPLNLNPEYRARILQGLCYNYWMAADPIQLKESAKALNNICKDTHLPESESVGQYFQGAAFYQLNELKEARLAIQHIAEDPFCPSFLMHVMGVEIKVMSLLALGENLRAQEYADRLQREMLSLGRTTFLPYAEALVARADLVAGNHAKALKWAISYTISPNPPVYHFSVPELTVIYCFLCDGSSSSLKKAEVLLRDMHAFFTANNNNRFLIETHLLSVILNHHLDCPEQSEKSLEEAVSLGEGGDLVRVFVDQGPIIAHYLNRLKAKGATLQYASKILAAFMSNDGKQNGYDILNEHTQQLIEPLSKRELEVLELIGKGNTNKEIGASLFIATATVKRHAESIYGKLGVSNRRSAVEKAVGLGILG